MSTGKTEHYGLHIWEAGDDFLLQEINENFNLLDRGIFEKSNVMVGVYSGTGSVPLTIELGFAPKGVIIDNQEGVRGTSPPVGGSFQEGHPIIHSKIVQAEVTDTGFIIHGRNLTLSNWNYYYMVIY